MADKYEEMARQMRADGVSEEMIARFVAEEMEEDGFSRGKGVTEIEALREWRKIPERIRKLLAHHSFSEQIDPCGHPHYDQARKGRNQSPGYCSSPETALSLGNVLLLYSFYLLILFLIQATIFQFCLQSAFLCSIYMDI